MSEFDVHQIVIKIDNLLKNPKAFGDLAEHLRNAYAIADDDKAKLLEAQNTISKGKEILADISEKKLEISKLISENSEKEKALKAIKDETENLINTKDFALNEREKTILKKELEIIEKEKSQKDNDTLFAKKSAQLLEIELLLTNREKILSENEDNFHKATQFLKRK